MSNKLLPKQKAIELIERFKIEDYDAKANKEYNMTNWMRKQAALIAVDEIIISRESDSLFDDSHLNNGSDYYTPHPMYLSYWKQVKKEIENHET